MKVTTISPANIAFIKYWGRADQDLFIPRNDNISMNMSGCKTTTTVELDEKLKEDEIEVEFFGGKVKKLSKDSRKEKAVFNQIDRIRKEAGVNTKVKIRSINNFPSDAGIAASASSFSALTGALLLAFGLDEQYEDKEEFSKWVRLCGSGSAVRSVMGGFVELIAGDGTHENSYANQIADENSWDLVDIVAVVNPEKKKFSSSHGHELADSSPYFEIRVEEMQGRIEKTREAILEKDIKKLGPLIEEDSTSMHSVMMTSKPPIYYWGPGSIRIMQDLVEWREQDDLHAYFTLDAGPNVHVICEKKDAKEVRKRLEKNEFVEWTIYNEPCEGTAVSDDHLF